MVINISRKVIQNKEDHIYVEYEGPSLRVGGYNYMLVEGEVSIIQHNYFRWRYYTDNPALEHSEIEPHSLEQVLSFYPEHLHPFIKINDEQ